jgi:hypothetical protein
LGGLFHHPAIIVPMKVEIYPTLNEALEKLEKGEALKTSSAALVSPVKVRYEKTPLENVEIEKPRYYDESVYYECLLFRNDKFKEINEDLKYLVELVERKRSLFERPIRELITEGMKEISSLKKEFICLGEVQLRANVIGWEIRVQDYRKKLLTTMEESGWKKELLYDELKKLIEREIERTDIEIVRNGRAKISIVDKEIGEKVKRIVADYWEEDKILGLDGSSDDKVMLNKVLSEVERKFGKKYLESVFPNIIGKIPLHLKDLESIVFIPLTIDKEQSREVVKFLPLTKQKVEAGSFGWSVIGKNEDLEAEITSSYIPITLIDQEEVPKEIMETAKEEGKKTILIRSDMKEDFKIIRKYFGNRKFRDKDQEVSIDMFSYRAKVDDLIKSLVIDTETEGPPKVFIERLEEKKGKVKDEKIYISILMRHSLYHLIKSISGAKEEKRVKGFGLLGRLIADSIEGEIEKMSEELKEREEKETDQDNITILKTARFLLERISETLSNGENVESESHLGGPDYCSYRLYPIATKGYKPIIEAEKEDLAWNRVGFQAPEIVKGIETAVHIINSKGLDKLCFNSVEGKRYIKITEVGDKNSKELLYIRSLTDKLAKAFGKYFIQEMMSREKEKSKERRAKNLKNLKMEEVLEKEVRDVNKLALLLSGAVVSSIKKFPKDMESTMRIMKNIYNRILLALTMGAYIYEKGEIKKRGNMALNWKELTKSILGAVVDLDIKEEITTEIPGEKEREIKRIEKKIEVGRSYNEGLLLYVDSGIKGKVILIETPGW